jgi:hypothetical protein
MWCSRYAFKPAKTQVKPPVESSACFTSSSPSPLKSEFVILTNVASFPYGVKIHTTAAILGARAKYGKEIVRYFSEETQADKAV